MTQATVKKQHKLLAQYDDETQQRIIDYSITNGYTGLFAPKDKPNGQGRGGGTRATSLMDDLTDTSWAR